MNIVEIYKKFPTHEDCIKYLESVRWQGEPKCPYCASTRVTPMKKENRYHCNNCNTSFSVTVGTIFHKTKIDCQKWFLAISLILNAKKGISARQLSRDIQVNKNTAWYMGMRVRKAMRENPELLKGIVEADETYIGGKPRRGGPSIKGRGTKKKAVIGVVERDGKIIAKPLKNLTSETLTSIIRRNVDIESAMVITDEFKGYLSLSRFVNHRTINHRKRYVNGDIHTNTVESFWALLKRGIIGQYHRVSVAYLPRYIDEFCYRHNNRKNHDIFNMTLTKAVEVRA